MLTEGEEPACTSPVDGRTTGFSHPKCYAQILNDCCDELTGEHYISKNILDQLGSVSISGVPWIEPGESKVLKSSTLLAKVLCRRHNNCLSDLDKRIGELFALLRRLDKCLRIHDEDLLREFKVHKAFWGSDLEKWMLKTYLGNIFSGNAAYNGLKIPRGTPIPEGQVRALFTPAPWPDDWGLYMVVKLGSKWRRMDGVGLGLHWDEDLKKLKSVQIEMMGAPFILYLESPPEHLVPDIMQRPRQVEMKVMRAKKSVRFQW